MKFIETVEMIIKYCFRLLNEIKSRQIIEGSQAKINNNYGAGAGTTWDTSVAIDTDDIDPVNKPAKRITITFAPTNLPLAFSNLEMIYSYSYIDGSPDFKLSYNSSPNLSGNNLVWEIITPFIWTKGTLYLKSNIKSVDVGSVTYAVSNITSF